MASRDVEGPAEERHDTASEDSVPAASPPPVELPAAPIVADPGGPDRRVAFAVIEAVLLAAVIALALALRFRGIEWGTGYYLHPDELFMTNVLYNLGAPAGVREVLQYGNLAAESVQPWDGVHLRHLSAVRRQDRPVVHLLHRCQQHADPWPLALGARRYRYRDLLSGGSGACSGTAGLACSPPC